jgi:hypothetical protein
MQWGLRSPLSFVGVIMWIDINDCTVVENIEGMDWYDLHQVDNKEEFLKYILTSHHKGQLSDPKFQADLKEIMDKLPYL